MGNISGLVLPIHGIPHRQFHQLVGNCFVTPDLAHDIHGAVEYHCHRAQTQRVAHKGCTAGNTTALAQDTQVVNAHIGLHALGQTGHLCQDLSKGFAFLPHFCAGDCYLAIGVGIAQRVNQLDDHILSIFVIKHVPCDAGSLIRSGAFAVDEHTDYMRTAFCLCLFIQVEEAVHAYLGGLRKILAFLQHLPVFLRCDVIILQIGFAIHDHTQRHNVNLPAFRLRTGDIGSRIGKNTDFFVLFCHIIQTSGNGPALHRSAKSFCRRASYTTTATLLDKFRQRAPSRMGIRTQRSGCSASSCSGSPLVSLPNSRYASGG